jgi:hypothetical protein
MQEQRLITRGEIVLVLIIVAEAIIFLCYTTPSHSILTSLGPRRLRHRRDSDLWTALGSRKRRYKPLPFVTFVRDLQTVEIVEMDLFDGTRDAVREDDAFTL